MPHEWQDSQQNCSKTYWVPGLKQQKMQPESDPSQLFPGSAPGVRATGRRACARVGGRVLRSTPLCAPALARPGWGPGKGAVA